MTTLIIFLTIGTSLIALCLTFQNLFIKNKPQEIYQQEISQEKEMVFKRKHKIKTSKKNQIERLQIILQEIRSIQEENEKLKLLTSEIERKSEQSIKDYDFKNLSLEKIEDLNLLIHDKEDLAKVLSAIWDEKTFSLKMKNNEVKESSHKLLAKIYFMSDSLKKLSNDFTKLSEKI